MGKIRLVGPTVDEILKIAPEPDKWLLMAVHGDIVLEVKAFISHTHCKMAMTNTGHLSDFLRWAQPPDRHYIVANSGKVQRHYQVKDGLLFGQED